MLKDSISPPSVFEITQMSLSSSPQYGVNYMLLLLYCQ